MSTCYQLVLLYKDHDDVADAICESVEHELRELRLNSSNVKIFRNPAAHEVQADIPTVCLFIGSKASKADAELNARVKELSAINIPVVPLLVGADQFEDVIPKALHPINSLLWKGSQPSANVTAWLLRLVGLTERQRRVFLSYRRSDALRMGEQAWEALSKAGFDVFLDRFSIDPAENFQERLTERLADKAFVLLIESPDTLNSKWVMHEVNYALKHRLGFMALTWPETKSRNLLVPGIFDGYRTYLTNHQLARTAGGYVEFSDAFLSTLPDQVEQKHAAAMLRRRRQLLDGIIDELHRNNLDFTQLSDWTVVVEGTRAATKPHWIVSVTPRPPEVPDLYLLDRHSTTYKRAVVEKAVLVHSTSRASAERADLLRWAIGSRKLTLRSEDQIVDLVLDLAEAARK